jgi:hypothetical protein
MKIKAYFTDQSYKNYNIIPQKHKREIFEHEFYNQKNNNFIIKNDTISNGSFLFQPYHCLPLKIANELGWVVTCPYDFSCIWDGNGGNVGVKISFNQTESEPQFYKPSQVVTSHFGAGIVTFSIPYIFRTPQKYALYLRGPTNHYKEGVQYLDAVVETDWLNYSFTYNIKIHSINKQINFKKGEPIFSFIPLDLSSINNSYVEVAEASKKIDMTHKLYSHKRRKVYNDSYSGYMEKLKNNQQPELYWMKDYFFGGATSKISENKIIGCPFLHFMKLNLDVVQNLTFKEKINKKIFLIKDKLKEKITIIKNTILKIYFDSFIFNFISSKNIYNQIYNKNINFKKYFKIYLKMILKNIIEKW